ncbi:MAG: HNH endonuclease [Actinobacteria bacterium]|nr:HNH endonuclease [Actinomycetota bacterium]
MGAALGFDGAVAELVPLEVLERELVTGWARQSAHLAEWLSMVAEFDRREGWAVAGVLSCAHWLAWRCGIDGRTAREHVRVALALEKLDRVRAAFAGGQLSYSKVRAVCRVATPENETFLLDAALDMTASQLDRMVTSYAATHGAPISLADDDERQLRCGVTRSVEPDGLVRYEVVLPPDEALLFDRALDFGADQLLAEARKAARDEARAAGEDAVSVRAAAGMDAAGGGAAPRVRRPSGPRGRADSLVWVVRHGLANMALGVEVEDPYLVVLHVHEGEAVVTDNGIVDLGNGLSMHPRTLQRHCCSSMIQMILYGRDGNDDKPLNLGRRVRRATRKQRQALAAMHETCVFPGCEMPVRWCELHHLDWWTNGGGTDLDNLRPLCRRHHHLCHEGGWRLVLGVAGEAVALPPGGRKPTRAAMPLSDGRVAAAALVDAVEAAGGVSAEAAVTLGGRFGGEMLDRWALDNLLYALAEASEPRPAPAEAARAPAPAGGPPPAGQAPAEPDGRAAMVLDAWLTSGSPSSPN